MKSQPAWRGLLTALIFAGTALGGRAASFSAELIDTQGNETRTGSFRFQENHYRFEVSQGALSLVVLHDAASGATRVLNTGEKAYYESGPDEDLSRLVNPFAGYAYFTRIGKVRTEGREAIDGHACTKQVAFTEGQDYATAWWSEEFGFPLKVEIPILARTVELRNIKTGPQDVALFAVPAGYQRISTDMEESAPDWAGQISGAPVLSPPFQRTLTEGQIVRMRPLAGREIKLVMSNPGTVDCALTAVPFKGGRPTSGISGNTCNLSPEQEASMTFPTTPAEADEIVVRARRATVLVKASVVGSQPGQSTATPPPAAEPLDLSASVSAPSAVPMGSRFEVSWTGPAAENDYVTVARTAQPPAGYLSLVRVREGNPVKIWAPSEPGEFEVRYILARGAKLLAKTTLQVNAVTATVETSGPVKIGGWIEVKWDGPAGENDYISVARADQPARGYLTMTRVKQGNPLRVRAPNAPGQYEVRYILARGAKLLARTGVTVEP